MVRRGFLTFSMALALCSSKCADSLRSLRMKRPTRAKMPPRMNGMRQPNSAILAGPSVRVSQKPSVVASSRATPVPMYMNET